MVLILQKKKEQGLFALFLEKTKAQELFFFSFFQGWVLPNKLSTAGCAASPSKVESTNTDLIRLASERLLNLEGAIERRFLKHPLTKR